MGLFAAIAALFKPRDGLIVEPFGVKLLARQYPEIAQATTSGLGPAILLVQDSIAAEQTMQELRSTFYRCWIDLAAGAVQKGKPFHPSGLLANAVVDVNKLNADEILLARNLGPVARSQVRKGYDLILLERQGALLDTLRLRTDFLNEGGVLAVGQGYRYQATTPNTYAARHPEQVTT